MNELSILTNDIPYKEYMNDNTIDSLNKLIQDKQSSDAFEAIDAINNDTGLQAEQKQVLISQIIHVCSLVITHHNCPDDYPTLKKEVQYLSMQTQKNFVLLAQRLRTIQINQLYTIDGYPDFKTFIENTLSISRSTVYKYIDIITFFDVELITHGNIQPTKLLPIIPVLKKGYLTPEAEQDIKTRYIEKAKTKSLSQIIKSAHYEKTKYISGTKKRISKTERLITALKTYLDKNNLTNEEIIQLRILKDHINSMDI
ncbi:MAG: hypothetical protein A2015_03630 [Spirochaetes bacterium GWF1_31_7]|nr:MAG: hypothetical protein A2Y29_04860 [Spirochaetes bacterium GWE2_31_10]OHD53227.1 MAG: hypothetical protein A2015_03630 [Spirochaetes bacterium GWF1_31_7]OHD83105.1 MAG: hypothetical protein A2355_11455 [Spirochaetes bacterium RIFOXYB1_FULL_32_8]HBD94743.1 hypothetical protein [Spirochaetia bacterium]HBI39071.1 hypothetical protein [Spirochaetia bacterium]